jgi:uracil-DNA glycosylase
MLPPEPDPVLAALREWLRNERRLGIAHLAVPRIALPRTAGPARSGPSAVAVNRPSPGDEGTRRASREAPAMPSSTPTRFVPRATPAAPSAPAPRSAPLAARSPELIPSPPLPTPTAGGHIADDPTLPPLCTNELSVDDARKALAELDKAFVHGCRKCRLYEHRTQTVFGVGHPRAKLVFVGEGPGADEDAKGEPFVGRAGQLLTRMIAAMGLTRDQVYICNVVKCRPPANRTPLEDEMAICAPLLFRQLAIIRPQVIVALGRPASQTLLATKVPIGKLRGAFQSFPPPAYSHFGLPPAKLMPTFHPAYLLRTESAKKDVWEDLKKVMAELGLKVPPKG